MGSEWGLCRTAPYSSSESFLAPATIRCAYRALRQVEVERPELEVELGSFIARVDEDRGRCEVTSASGARYVARLSSNHADTSLIVEELTAPNALELCNCCEVIRAASDSPAGYCSCCEPVARDGVACWHDPEHAA